MKKILVSLAALMMAVPALASRDCAYTPLQNLIRNVRSVEEINRLIQQGVVFDEKVHCGGSLMQLAILRGNASVLKAMLNQDKTRANAMVDLSDFQIEGAPQEIPLILFAAYYAPNFDIIGVLYESGADISKVDSSGRNLLWYMEQNPVLRNTELSDQLNAALLTYLIPTSQNRQFNVNQQQPATQQIQQPAVQQAQQPTGTSVVEATEPAPAKIK